MNKIIEGLREAVAVAKGAIPAARLTINGHAYVPEASQCELATMAGEKKYHMRSRTDRKGEYSDRLELKDKRPERVYSYGALRDALKYAVEENARMKHEIVALKRENAQLQRKLAATKSV